MRKKGTAGEQDQRHHMLRLRWTQWLGALARENVSRGVWLGTGGAVNDLSPHRVMLTGPARFLGWTETASTAKHQHHTIPYRFS